MTLFRIWRPFIYLLTSLAWVHKIISWLDEKCRVVTNNANKSIGTQERYESLEMTLWRRNANKSIGTLWIIRDDAMTLINQ